MQKNKRKVLANWEDIKNAKSNWKKVRASPYASMIFGYQIKKWVIGFLILFIAYTIFNSVRNYHVIGFMGMFSKVAMIGLGIYICYKIWGTLDSEKKKIDYYKRNPHLINYAPTDVKQDINEILEAFESNGQRKILDNQKEVQQNATVQKRKDTTNSSTKSSK